MELIGLWKRNIRLVLWRAKIRATRGGSRRVYDDLNRAYWVDPARIRLSLDNQALDRLAPGPQVPTSPIFQRGEIKGGDWDLAAIPFEAMDVWEAFMHRFRGNGRWEDTGFYRRIVKTIEGGIRLFGCSSPGQVRARFEKIDELFNTIKRDGYKLQTKVKSASPVWFAEEDEIHVHIGRDGDYIFADGRHRLCIAKLLDLPLVAVKVARRHAAWVDFRKEILAYKDRNRGKLYAPISHPDLSDIPSAHSAERMELLTQGFEAAFGGKAPHQGRLLDIGAHWGYFTQQCERLGFDGEAVENSPINQYFLEKLKRAENCRFKLIRDSVLNINGDLNYDVVLALNIFHHFLKTQEDYEAFCAFLKRIKTRYMFFEPHKPDEPQMRLAFKDLPPEQFAGFVREQCGLNRATMLGAAEDGRVLYLLS